MATKMNGHSFEARVEAKHMNGKSIHNGHALNGMNGYSNGTHHVNTNHNNNNILHTKDAKQPQGNDKSQFTHHVTTNNNNPHTKDVNRPQGDEKSRFRWFYGFLTLNTKILGSDEDWIYEEEPHTGRRKEILTKHPEIKSLMGPDPWIVVPTSVSVVSQLILCWLMKDVSWPFLFFMAYTIGGIFNHSLGSAIHEIGHNLAFGHGKRAWMNRVLSLFCNLPLGVPMAITYRKYHADHHRYLGEEMQDVDIPTRLESFLFRHPITKMIWLFLHPLLHSIRPFYKSPKPLSGWEFINAVVQFSFDFFIFSLFGIKPVVYMVAGTLLALGLHPLAGHFISEHYLFTEGQATHSYYGPLNFILYNVGYHNEHHDFPYIPYTRLEKLRQMAPEYYNHLPYHTSWVKVVWDFIFDKNMGPHAHGVGFKKD